MNEIDPNTESFPSVDVWRFLKQTSISPLDFGKGYFWMQEFWIGKQDVFGQVANRIEVDQARWFPH